jgi:plastocyanin
LAVLIGAGGVVLWLNPKRPSTSGQAVTHQAIIQISSTGFTPSTLTVKQGTTIVWKNNDTAPHIVASNPYPADNSVPTLHSQSIPPSGSYAFTPTTTGTISYHDDLAPTHNGVIVVTE